MCAIELDDSTHQQYDRKVRDAAINYVFESAHLPLLRVPSDRQFSPERLRAMIEGAIKVVA